MAADYSFREGGPADLADTYALGQRALAELAAKRGFDAGSDATEAAIDASWARERPLIEFLAAQPEGHYWLCDGSDGLLGYARVVPFGEMESLTELMVLPGSQSRGIGRALLERCWSEALSPEVGRVVVASGDPADLSLYTAFGAMPVAGHWLLEALTERFVERRALEIDSTEPGVVALEPAHAVAEWLRLEPGALGHDRRHLHEFFGRDRACLATVDAATGVASALCWISSDGEIGPAVGAEPPDLVPVVLAALDRVASTQEPGKLEVVCPTISWWLLRRLRALGFRVTWPGWVMCSRPLPGLDRYLATQPDYVL